MYLHIKLIRFMPEMPSAATMKRISASDPVVQATCDWHQMAVVLEMSAWPTGPLETQGRGSMHTHMLGMI